MTPKPSAIDQAGTPPSGEPEEGYRQLSTGAVASLVVGLASPIALLSGVLTVVPLAALAFGLLALRWIATDPGARSGRGLALAGANLGVLVMAMVGANAVATPWLVDRQAARFGEAWLDRVRAGDLELAAAMAVLPTAEPDEAQAPTIAEAWPVVAELRALEGWSRTDLVQTVDRQALGRGRWLVDQRFRLIGDDGPRRSLVLRMVRQPAGGITAARWTVNAIDPPKPAAPR